MIRDIALEYAKKGGPGSGFSDPNCRRGIPGQRGGSVNVCEPGGLAKAVALGVDVSDINFDPLDFTKEHSGTTKVDRLHAIRSAVQERVDEPNKVTRRQIISQQLSLPYTPYQRDNEYNQWKGSSRLSPDLWNAASDIEGISPREMGSFRLPFTGEGHIEDKTGFARSVAADVELSRELWPDNQVAYRGLRARDNQSWVDAMNFLQAGHPDANIYVPNNFLESWSTDYNQAADFATQGFKSDNPQGVVMEQKFGPDYVFLNHYAVPALEPESEVIVVNRSPFDVVPVHDFTVL